MKSSTLKHWSGNLVALALGASACLFFNRIILAPRELEDGVGLRESVAGTGPNRPARGPHSSRAEKSAAYAQAWAELKTQPDLMQNTWELRRLQNKLLAEWVEIDDRAALAAALAETRESYSTSSRDARSLLHAFDAYILDQPLRFWALVKDESFGLETGLARAAWINQLGEHQPEVLASFLAELGPQSKTQALARCLDNPQLSPEALGRLLDSLAELPPTSENLAMLDLAGGAMANKPLAELVALLQSSDQPGIARMTLGGIATRLGKSESTADFKQSLAEIPADLRTDALDAGASQIKDNPIAFAGLIDEMIAAGEWPERKRELSFKLHNMLAHVKDPLVLADWATTIPQQTEFEDLYRVGIRSYVNSSPTDAMEWIKSLPSGWHRDNSLVAYVQSSLNLRQNEEQAREAYKMIEDQHFIESGDEMFRKWHKR